MPTVRPPLFLAGALGAAFALLIAIPGCEPYRIEYRSQPAFYAKAGVEERPDREVLEDGTIVIYETQRANTPFEEEHSRGEKGDPLQLREELEDGSIVLRCLLPEHVLANLFTCLRNQEYELIWDQLLAEQSRRTYTEEGRSEEDFIAFFGKHRTELARTVNRMLLGISHEEVEVKYVGDSLVGCRLRSHIADQFRFTQIEMVREEGFLKLCRIR